MLSADNAHALHPNHPEKTDINNCVYLNEGVVIKSHAGQKYTSDALSIAVFKGLCKQAEVPVQFFANRSDSLGGSTLGNIAMAVFPNALLTRFKTSYKNVESAPCFVPEPTSSLSKQAYTLIDLLLNPFKKPCKEA